MEPNGIAKVLIVTAFLSCLLGLINVLVVRWVAHRVGLVDRPDPTRKLHRGNVALGGGLAVLISVGLSTFLAFEYIALEFGLSGMTWSNRWTALSVASAMMVLLGVIDDRFVLRGKQKLIGQMAIVFGLALAWQPSGAIIIFGMPVELGVLALPLVMIWLLASINAVNLIDGADGVAGSFGVVAAAGIALVAFINGHATVALVAVAMGASLAGFLCFNRPPATIFLGDAGSMLIGLVLGTLACWSVEQAGAPQDVLIPIALIGVPLFDSVVAILRRVLTGRSIYMPDRGHLHHILGAQLSSRGLTPMWMLAAFGGLSALTSTGAVVGTVFANDAFAVLAIILVVAGLVWSRTFGHAEARLLASHTRRVGGRIVSKVRKVQPKAHVSGVPLQGNRQWDVVWLPLVDFAAKNDLAQLRLDLNMPWRHEGYHGHWSCGSLPDKADQWSVRLPIICHGRRVGHLMIVGEAEGESQLESLEAFSYLIGELQPAIEQLVCSLSTVHVDDPHTTLPTHIGLGNGAGLVGTAKPTSSGGALAGPTNVSAVVGG